jgi:hypothetical protein
MLTRIPEILLGSLLAIAVLAIGLALGSQYLPQQASQIQTSQHASEVTIWGMRVGEGLLALATLLLVCVTLWLVLDGRRNARRQLRAYKSAEPEGIVEFIPRDRVVARIRFHNTGSIFAKDVCSFVDWKLSDNGELPETEFIIDETKISGDNVIAPRGTIRYATGAISKSQIDAGRSAAKRADNQFYLYVWGILKYHDGFISGRYTKFCHRYNFSGIPEGEYKIPEENYRYHHHGNKIDDKD